MNFNAFWLKLISLKSWRSNVVLILKVLRVAKHLELWIKIEVSDFVIGISSTLSRIRNGLFWGLVWCKAEA
jgi:hypothetical protein